jgi:hypothetical protein
MQRWCRSSRHTAQHTPRLVSAATHTISPRSRGQAKSKQRRRRWRAKPPPPPLVQRLFQRLFSTAELPSQTRPLTCRRKHAAWPTSSASTETLGADRRWRRLLLPLEVAPLTSLGRLLWWLPRCRAPQRFGYPQARGHWSGGSSARRYPGPGPSPQWHHCAAGAAEPAAAAQQLQRRSWRRRRHGGTPEPGRR